MVGVESESDSSFNSDYMIRESNSKQMRPKNNNKPYQDNKQNHHQKTNQKDFTLRVDTHGDK